MLRLQSSMASQINGGQLNELVNTAKNLLANAQVHYDKYYALPNTPGLDENPADRLEEQYRIYSATLTQMNVLLGRATGRYVQTECRTEADGNAKGLSRVARGAGCAHQ